MTTEVIEQDPQELAINSYKTPGTYLVLAGPGTGKTYTIIQRIKSMIEAGIDQEKILCLTFSDAAAREMRKRLEEELKISDIQVNICTFHSFCLNLIQDNPDIFSLKEKFNIINDSFSYALIKECLEDENITPKLIAYNDEKGNFYKFIPEIKKCIDELKKYRYKVTDKKLFKNNLENNPFWKPRKKELEDEKELKKSENKSFANSKQIELEKLTTKIAQMNELWDIYELYQAKMQERNLIDFTDMINMVLEKFESDKTFLNKIANDYQYIMVDEYQDTNFSQNEIVIKLAEAQEKKNIFVVGDDDQIIYTFQGASLDTINNFKAKFSKTNEFKEITFKQNYRSIQTILDLAYEIITNPDNSGRIHKDKLKSANENETKYANVKKDVQFLPFDNVEYEYDYIVRDIDNLIKSDVCPIDKDTKEKKLSEIAILLRSHDEINKIARLLKNSGIQVQTSGGKNIFEIPSVIVMFLYMQFLVNPLKYENKFFELLLMKPFCIHPKDYELLQAMKTNYLKKPIFNNKMIEDIEEIIKNTKENKDTKTKLISYLTMEKFISSYKEIKNIINKEDIKNTILTIGTKSGIFAEFINGNSQTVENIEGILKLIDEADAFSQIDNPCNFINFVEYLNRNLNNDICINTDKPDTIYNAVQVLTLHDSKGREFEYVYMPSVGRKKWEGNSNSNKPIIPLSNFKEKETFKEIDNRYSEYKLSEQLRLMYVGITRAKHTLKISNADIGKSWETRPSKYIKEYIEKIPFIKGDGFQSNLNSLIKFDYKNEDEFNAMLDSYINKLNFSATSLNTYISCPRKYLFGTILKLKVRDNNQDSLNFGLAVHKAYQDTVKLALNNDGKYPDENVFQKIFEDDMQNRIFSERKKQEGFFIKWGLIRKNAYNHLCEYPAKDLREPEYKFTQKIDDETFTFVIDRIPLINGNYYIHDYKTGDKPESIEKLKKIHDDYYNQLALYKYALQLNLNQKIKDCVLIYPLDDNNIELPLLISDDDCEEVKQMYLGKIKDIRAHKFPAEPSNKFFGCKGCSFQEICKYYKEDK